MAKILRAISIRQPFVELILLGKKKFEYRSRPTNIRERVYLYASNTPADYAKGWKQVRKFPGELPTGSILGSVEIVNCRYDSANDCYSFQLKAPKRLRKHLIAKNQPSPMFWRPRFDKLNSVVGSRKHR